MADRAGGGFAVEVALAVWGRRKRLAGMLFGALLAGIATLTLSLPSIYRATATLLVEQPGVPEGAGRWTVTGDLETRLHTIQEEVLSRARLEALLDRFDLYPELRSPGKRDAAVERLWGDIQVKLRGADAGMGRPTTIAFSVSFRGRDPETVARVANALASFYIEENLRIRERARLARLKQELARMQDLYSNQHPDVLRLRAEIASTERQLADGAHTMPAVPGGWLDAVPVGPRAEAGGREPRLDATAGKPRDTARVGPDVDRQQASAEFRVLDPAIPNRKTVAPNRFRLALMGLLFAAGATAAAVLLIEHLDSSFHALDEVRTFTTVPVLASIPRIVTAADVGPRPLWVTAAPIAVGLALVVLASYYFAHGNEQLVRMLSRGAS